jgi:predicted HicB family RNase H-like nuclease
MSHSKRVNITIPEDVLEMAKKYATSKQYTLSYFIKKALEKDMNDSVFRVDDDIYAKVVEQAKEFKMKSEDLIKEALEDALAPNKITISCTESTKETYHKMFAFEGVSDLDFEPYLKNAMAQYLQDKVIDKLKS